VEDEEQTFGVCFAETMHTSKGSKVIATGGKNRS
jgi:hypothetical protein